MSDNEQTIQEIIEINKRVCLNLWNIANTHSTPTGISPRLILPIKRDETDRISEQESKNLSEKI